MSELNSLKLFVRIDRPGRIGVEFQSMAYRPGKDPIKHPQEILNPQPKHLEKNRENNRIFHKSYLRDASFLVILEGDSDLVHKCAKALKSPQYQLFLGRRNCPPSGRVLVGVFDSDAEFLLQTLQYPEQERSVLVVRDADDGERGQLVQDIIVTNAITNRRFAYRETVEEIVERSPHDPFSLFEETTPSEARN